MPSPVLTDMEPRLRAAAADVRDAEDRLKAARELRNELIVAAIDNGMAQRAISRITGLTISRVNALQFGAPDDEN